MSLTLAAALAACTIAKSAAADSDELTIFVLEKGARCEVQGKVFSCSDLPADIRHVLVVDHKCHFKIEARGSPPYESVRALIESLKDTGCKFGFVNTAPPQPSKE